MSITPEFKKISRSTLYFNKYKYKVRANIPGAGLAKIHQCKTIHEYKIHWDRVMRYKHRYTNIYNPDFEVIEKFIYLMNSGKDFMVRTENHIVSFFFNDPEVYDGIKNISPVTINAEYIETYDMGELRLVNPKHNFRTFVKEVPKENVIEMLTSFMSYTEQLVSPVNFSRSIQDLVSEEPKSLYRYYRRTWRGGHIDYNDEQMVSIIHLHLGSMVGKTVKLVKIEKVE